MCVNPSLSRSQVSAEGSPLKPEIAIVTITKDDASGIRKTVESVQRQDFSQYEHVVVDGGSQSDIAEWLASWRDGDAARRILIENPPDGIYPAMNAGIQSTIAPIILILNGGDELRPGSLRIVSEHHKLHGWRWAYGGVEGRDQHGRSVGEYTFTPYSKRNFRAGLDNIPHPAAYVTRDLYYEIGLYRDDLGTGADQELFLRACTVAEPGHIPGVLAVFELGGVSSQEGIIGREISWHRMRLASDTAFGGNSAVDLVVTSLLLLHRFQEVIVRKLRRSFKVGRTAPRDEP